MIESSIFFSSRKLALETVSIRVFRWVVRANREIAKRDCNRASVELKFNGRTTACNSGSFSREL